MNDEMSSNFSLWDIHPFSPEYYPAAVRNVVTMSPGLISVIMLTSIIRRKREMFHQYRFTVVFLTYGGFVLAIPIISFNIFMCIVIPLRPQFLISTLACSLIKQFCAATMNSSFAISCSISMLRYVLVLFGKELKLPHLLLFYALVSFPLYIYFVLSFFVGSISPNDECPMFIEINWNVRPLLYFGYLSLIIIATDFFNIRILWFLIQHKKKLSSFGMSGNEGYTRKERDQLNLSIGLLIQSLTVTCTFGSTILFMLLFSYGISVPAWLSTITNTLSSISTLVNPLSAAIFIRPFRREMLKSITCSSKIIVEEIMGPNSIATTKMGNRTGPRTITVTTQETTISGRCQKWIAMKLPGKRKFRGKIIMIT